MSQCDCIDRISNPIGIVGIIAIGIASKILLRLGVNITTAKLLFVDF